MKNFYNNNDFYPVIAFSILVYNTINFEYPSHYKYKHSFKESHV